ncbi:hypothetical protein LINGRAHAP2_LOCUS14287, partial [Linum grandiflorum]
SLSTINPADLPLSLLLKCRRPLPSQLPPPSLPINPPPTPVKISSALLLPPLSLLLSRNGYLTMM